MSVRHIQNEQTTLSVADHQEFVAKQRKRFKLMAMRIEEGSLEAVQRYYDELMELQRQMFDEEVVLVPFDEELLEHLHDQQASSLSKMLDDAIENNDRGRMRAVMQAVAVLDEPELLLKAQNAYEPHRKIELEDDSALIGGILNDWSMTKGGPVYTGEEGALTKEWERKNKLFEAGQEQGDNPSRARKVQENDNDPWY